MDDVFMPERFYPAKFINFDDQLTWQADRQP
jgi:hypothetical protein